MNKYIEKAEKTHILSEIEIAALLENTDIEEELAAGRIHAKEEDVPAIRDAILNGNPTDASAYIQYGTARCGTTKQGIDQLPLPAPFHPQTDAPIGFIIGKRNMLEDLKNQTNCDSFEAMVDKGVRLHENWYKHNAIKKRVPEARCVNSIDMIRARRLMQEEEKYGQLFEKLITLPISLKDAGAVYSDLFTNLYAVLSEYMSPMEATEKTNELLSDFNQNLL